MTTRSYKASRCLGKSLIQFEPDSFEIKRKVPLFSLNPREDTETPVHKSSSHALNFLLHGGSKAVPPPPRPRPSTTMWSGVEGIIGLFLGQHPHRRRRPLRQAHMVRINAATRAV